MVENLIDTIIGLVVGFVIGAGIVWQYLYSRITKPEVDSIMGKIIDCIDTYNKSIKDENLSIEEKLEIADKSISIIQEFIKSLKE